MKRTNSTVITFVYLLSIMFFVMIGIGMEQVLDTTKFSFILIHVMWMFICMFVSGLGTILFFKIKKNSLNKKLENNDI